MAIPAATAGNNSIEATELSQETTSQKQKIKEEHSPEPLNPTSIVNILDDDGPTHRKAQLLPKWKKTERDEQTQRERRGSFDDASEEGNNQQK